MSSYRNQSVFCNEQNDRVKPGQLMPLAQRHALAVAEVTGVADVTADRLLMHIAMDDINVTCIES